MTAAEDGSDPVPGGPGRPRAVATRAGVSRDTARNQILLDHPDALAATALRTRSLHAREVLVESAWPGHGAEEIDGWAGRASPAQEASVPDGADAYHLGQYARVLVLQTQDPVDVERGRAILEALTRAGHLDRLHPQAAQLLLHLRLQGGDAEAARALLDHPRVPADVADAARADLANPHLGAEATEEEWLDLLHRALLGPDLAPLRLSPEPQDTPGVSTPFDRLTADLPKRTATPPDGSLVTVVVSAHRPGPSLLTAVRSLTAQTWSALEILVVDDASGPDAERWLRAAQDLDPRVRVIRKAVNGGTYRARNTALRQARGAYLTTLDSDDWLHPQAVETLLTALHEDPSLVAARALGARVTEDLALVRLGYRHRAVAAPTLLVRLDPALSRVGFFDPARKSADTEFARRLQAAFGERSVRTVEECLLLLRSGDTLSAGEFSRMWRHPARHAYKSLYTPWHEEIAAGATAYLDPQESRPIPEPRRWTGPHPRDPDLPAPRHLHLVLGGDWRRYGGPQRSMLEEARAAREAGLRVGIMHLEALRFATVKDLSLCGPVTELLRAGELEWVQVDDDVEIDVVMVRYPLVLQHPPTVPVPRPLRPRHLLVMANQAPLEPDGSDQRYVVADVTARATELFGTAPAWVPQGPVIRDLLRAQDPDIALTGWDNPGLIDVAEWARRDRPAPGTREGPVVVGRFSRDHPLKHPATHADLLAAYDLGEGYTVRMMGTRATLRRLAQEAGLDPDQPVPANWELLRAGSLDPRDFLAGIDVFLYQDHPERHEAFGRVLLEAAAAGVLVVAHPKHRPVFGDLLDYALPAESRTVIDSYVRDPQRYVERVARMQAGVRERFSHASFVERLRSLPGLGEDWGRAGSVGAAWVGRAGAHVSPTGDPRRPARLEIRVQEGPALRVHETVLRSAADAGRADQLLLALPQPLSEPAEDALRRALATPSDGQVVDALRDALRRSPEIPLALLVQDGVVHALAGPGGAPWPLTDGPRALVLGKLP